METRTLICSRVVEAAGRLTFDVLDPATAAPPWHVADGNVGDMAPAVSTARGILGTRDGATNRSVPGECVAVGWREL